MATTIVGYNRDPCESGVATKIDTLGVDAVTKDDNIVCIPAGYGISQIQIKLVSQSLPLAGVANNLEIVVDNGVTQVVLMSVDKTVLNTSPSVSLVGTDGAPLSLAALVEQGLKLRADTGDFGPAGPTVCILVKIKPMPVL